MPQWFNYFSEGNYIYYKGQLSVSGSHICHGTGKSLGRGMVSLTGAQGVFSCSGIEGYC